MFCIGPKPFDAVDVVPGFWEFLSMTDRVMIAQAFQRTIAVEGVGEIDGPLARLRGDMFHELLGTDRFDNTGVDTSIALQKPQNNTFACCTTSPLTFTMSTKVRLIEFNFSSEASRFQFAGVVQSFPQALIHTGDGLVIDTKIPRQSIRWLLLVKTGNDFHFPMQHASTFLSPTAVAFDISSGGTAHLERTAENTFLAVQKVVEATQNPLMHCYIIYLHPPYGYKRT